MGQLPTPEEIFNRAVGEGERRLDQSLLELIATGFIAGSTVVFGVVAAAIVESLARPHFGEFAAVLGGLAFGIGLVFLIIGRAELITENFFDPVATWVKRRRASLLGRLGRLWGITLVLNLAGSALIAWILSIQGVLPDGTSAVLSETANEIAARSGLVVFLKGIAGGMLVTLLSFLLHSAERAGAQIALAYTVGFLLTLGPFDHVVLTALHLFFGVLFGVEIELGTVLWASTMALAGNLIGGLGLVTLTHIAQAERAVESSD